MLNHGLCWAMEPQAFGELCERWRALAAAGAMKSGREPAAQVVHRRDGALGIIEVAGVLMRRPSAFEVSELGATGYEAIAAGVDALNADPSVEKIAMLVDSPGGSTLGNLELATQIRRSAKPVHAFAGGLVASAAYKIAAAARELVTTSTAIVGSIGTIMAVVDLSGMAGQLGIKVTTIRSGPLKGTAPGDAVPREQVDALQDLVDEYGMTFRNFVKQSRPKAAPFEADWGKSGVYTGSSAPRVGLVDRLVGSEAEFLAELQASITAKPETVGWNRPTLSEISDEAARWRWAGVSERAIEERIAKRAALAR